MYVFGRETINQRFLDARLSTSIRVPRICGYHKSYIPPQAIFTGPGHLQYVQNEEFVILVTLEDLEIELICEKIQQAEFLRFFDAGTAGNFRIFGSPIPSFLMLVLGCLYFECMTIDSSKLEASPFLRTKLTFGLYPPKVWKDRPIPKPKKPIFGKDFFSKPSSGSVPPFFKGFSSLLNFGGLLLILLMEEILHHLGWLKTYK